MAGDEDIEDAFLMLQDAIAVLIEHGGDWATVNAVAAELSNQVNVSFFFGVSESNDKEEVARIVDALQKPKLH